MSFSFNADDVFEMAEQIERNGARFYRRAAQGSIDLRARQLLLDLAIMEDEHEKIFAAMRADLSPRERELTVPDPYGEALSHLPGMAEGPLFDVEAHPAERLTGKETILEILRTAIGLEKDSIVFYEGMKEMVPERLGRHRIDAIIKEEMGHIAMLSKAVASLRR